MNNYFIFFREDHTTEAPEVVFQRMKHHKGSIYCVAWNPMGDIIATGSNDKSIRMMRYNSDNHTAGKNYRNRLQTTCGGTTGGGLQRGRTTGEVLQGYD